VSPTVLAIVAARNESDVIPQTVHDLISQGIEVYLLDDGSTDDTVDRIRPWLGAGVRAIETLPPEPAGRFSLGRILARKEEIARTVDADWYVNHDADELREAPLPDMTFKEGIALVDRLGFTAIDFAVLDFVPTDDGFAAGADLRRSFPYYEPSPAFNHVQVRCWKRHPEIDLQSSGGHDARFPGRRVFPVRFLLRHYPIRSSAQGQRKIFDERLPRFDPDERAKGWHVQYEGLTPETPLLKSQDALVRFDGDAVRLQLLLEHREVEHLERELAKARQALRTEAQRAEAAEAAVGRQAGELAARAASLQELAGECARSNAEIRALQAELRELRQSWSWRWTAPARALARALFTLVPPLRRAWPRADRPSRRRR
jgi:hypothetical protein